MTAMLSGSGSRRGEDSERSKRGVRGGEGGVVDGGIEREKENKKSFCGMDWRHLKMNNE